LRPIARHITRLRFGIKFIFSSEIETIDGDEGMNLGHGSSAQDSFPLLEGFLLTCMNEQIVDPIEGWTFLCAIN
jgi:hypothetical protein